jgi:TrmH family RNA methyltransferase
VDVYAPKVVRSAMGAHFHLPIYMASWEEIYTLEQANKLQVYVAAANAGLIYSQVNLRQPLALVIGGEAEGASQAAWSQDHICIRIPMSARVESLNAAAAAAVLLFEVARQRQTHFSASFS